MPKNNKLTHHSRKHYKGSRRSKPKVSALNRELLDKIKAERELIQDLTADAQFRRSQLARTATPIDELSVWEDCDQYRDYTKVVPEHLPKWEDVSDFLKIQLIQIASLIFGGYAITATVRPTLQARWAAKNINAGKRIFQLISNELSKAGLSHHPFLYVIEGKGKRGYGATNLHIHGIIQTDDPSVATAFKLLLERTLGAGKLSKVEAGYTKKSGAPVQVKAIYEGGTVSERTVGRWASYITKNATKPEKRLGAKRCYMSNEARALARELWAYFRQEDPIGAEVFGP